MKKLSFLLIGLLISTICISQKNIKKIVVKETGYDLRVSFSPKSNTLQYTNGLTIEVTPISADELNLVFDYQNQFNGKNHFSNYEKSRDSYFLKNNRSKREKSNIEFLLEGLDFLLDNKTINQDEYDYLSTSITSSKPAIPSVKTSDDVYAQSNPYFLDKRYLSLFKIELTNSSGSNITFDDKLLVSNNTTLLNPLSTEFLISEQERSGQMTTSKRLALERYNMTYPVIIPSGSAVIKYFAVLPIDYSFNALSISSSILNKKMTWQLSTDKKIIDDSYTFYELDINYIDDLESSLVSPLVYTLTLTKDPNSIFLSSDNLYVNQNSINEPCTLICYALSDDRLYFARINNITAVNYLDFNKSRRITVAVKMTMIKELAKK